MDGKATVAIEDALKLIEACNDINSVPFEDIKWTFKGKEIEINRAVFHNWMLSGLDNLTFVASGVYKSGIVPETGWKVYYTEED